MGEVESSPQQSEPVDALWQGVDGREEKEVGGDNYYESADREEKAVAEDIVWHDTSDVWIEENQVGYGSFDCNDFCATNNGNGGAVCNCQALTSGLKSRKESRKEVELSDQSSKYYFEPVKIDNYHSYHKETENAIAADEVVGVMSNYVMMFFAIIGALTLVYWGTSAVHNKLVSSSTFTPIEDIAEC